MDWNALREEYISDESCSYRKLAKKYGVGLTALYNHGKKEDWGGQREQLKSKTMAKSLEKISDKKAKQAAKYNDMVDTMTAKLTAAIESVDPKDTTAVRRLTASLCDLKELLGIKSDADSREQEARIANLRRQADKEDDVAGDIEVIFAAGPEEWNG